MGGGTPHGRPQLDRSVVGTPSTRPDWPQAMPDTSVGRHKARRRGTNCLRSEERGAGGGQGEGGGGGRGWGGRGGGWVPKGVVEPDEWPGYVLRGMCVSDCVCVCMFLSLSPFVLACPSIARLFALMCFYVPSLSFSLLRSGGHAGVPDPDDHRGVPCPAERSADRGAFGRVRGSVRLAGALPVLPLRGVRLAARAVGHQDPIWDVGVQEVHCVLSVPQDGGLPMCANKVQTRSQFCKASKWFRVAGDIVRPGPADRSRATA